ncbi:MAG: beta-ketoacyl-ACP synthase III [Gammaproteobacteria bacterium]|uniref:beta-ketoacyl-ACP synthase III n=1 Tax=Rhodoferax sp. TaxID=50421 RepID=UPI0018078559|nr:beta-ketoacyl-ACP synthase III [Rhodoferax sp.]MBU3899771.1 beta-ketoacyl-ACP synthase III [Gammaproteobacteria bacterium]MBA3057380.1 beta-ketoacyl-ACP synthase III [Rhodoferax sp.]MBU3997037.1 beta-ketoacyl-ACP synthase III [Gammaproteobacteria bacterium]MBU4019035.1 beta-ketoacyl-ACP synthase III [Gammaproteobacteria bacterium]MBU4078754.1 beta-ketoacyl-ACP synthase III [Gammaproteobacteria bacterium]
MHRVAISSTGLYIPPYIISNEELVASFNTFAAQENAVHADAIAAGARQPVPLSSTEFIEKASGIKQRYVMEKSGILDPQRMRPRLRVRPDSEISLMAEIGVAAARDALARAGKTAKDVDGVICACSNLQRAYPAIAVEIQAALGIQGFGFDMNVACSSATFGIEMAVNAVKTGSARAILVVDPEVTSAHLAWQDRDCHFIFGDVGTAVLVERLDSASAGAFEVLGTRLLTSFSNTIRNNAGYMWRSEDRNPEDRDLLFYQEGRKVFKDVCPMAAEHMSSHLAAYGFAPAGVRRFWLHQANLAMNQLISRRLLGRDATADEAPVILDEFANTASAGSIIAFHRHHDDMLAGEVGVICSFGAGYSIGSAVLRRL